MNRPLIGLRTLGKKLWRNEQGVAAIETALVMPVFMFCIYGIIEFGRYAYTQGALMYAAEETTRFATVNYDATDDDLIAVASGKTLGIRQDKIQDINVNTTLNSVDQTKLVTLEIVYQHDFIMPIFDVEGVTVRGTSKGFLVEK